ncbi:hypothetical protein J2799_002584 [Chryseobacterium vietnamense]|nr:hypothetical protein [Chryseobacterium vietnamense]
MIEQLISEKIRLGLESKKEKVTKQAEISKSIFYRIEKYELKNKREQFLLLCSLYNIYQKASSLLSSITYINSFLGI